MRKAFNSMNDFQETVSGNNNGDYALACII